MATPHVAGTAALLAAAEPELTVGELRAALLDGTDQLGSLSGRVASGGRLDSRRSLEIAAPGTIPDPEPPVSVRATRRQRLGQVLARGLPVRVSCSEPCSVRLQLLLGPREARKARLSRGGRTVAIGTLGLSRTVSRRVSVGLPARARAQLARLGAITVTLQARGADSAANARPARQRVVLTR